MKKIPTLYERVFDGHKIIDVLPTITPGCEDALLHGVPTVKIDGNHQGDVLQAIRCKDRSQSARGVDPVPR